MIACSKRLRKEWDGIRKEGDSQIQLFPKSEDNIMEWVAIILGPEGSPYQNFSFQLSISVSSSYPMVAPKISFVTKCFHPNVYFETGEICLDILKTEWSPAWSLQTACRAIIALLSTPAADSPLNCDAGNIIRAGDMAAFNSVAKMYCHDCAIPSPSGVIPTR